MVNFAEMTNFVSGAGVAWSRPLLSGAGADPNGSEQESAPEPEPPKKVAASQHCKQHCTDDFRDYREALLL